MQYLAGWHLRGPQRRADGSFGARCDGAGMGGPVRDVVHLQGLISLILKIRKKGKEKAIWQGKCRALYSPLSAPHVVANGCDPYPNSTMDLCNYIALVRHRSCLFAQEVQHVVHTGAKYVIIYKNAPSTLQYKSLARPVCGLEA